MSVLRAEVNNRDEWFEHELIIVGYYIIINIILMSQFPLALTFDDVLLLPGYSDIRRRDVDLGTHITKRLRLALPLISAPMDTVTESVLAIALAQAGGLGVIHKNLTPAEQAVEVKKVKSKKLLVGAAVSYGDDAIERALAVIKAGADALFIDTAHGHSKGVIAMVKLLKNDKRFNKIDIVAGNVGTAEGAQALIKAGADAVKVGIGPGSICTTRVVTGIGVPQLTAVMEAVKVAKKFNTPIIADGGINYSGDIVKALAVGASAVMIGRLFAATREAPGTVVTIGGKKFKRYRGMGSVEAMQRGSKDRYGQAEASTKQLVPEGVAGLVPYAGPLAEYVEQMIGGIKGGCVYIGARNLRELTKKAKFVQITQASLRENHPHDLADFKRNVNY